MRANLFHFMVLPLAGVALLLPLFLLPACGNEETQEAPATIDSAKATTETSIPKAPAKSRFALSADIGDEPLLPGQAGMVLAFDVEGMTCSSCANTLNEAISPIKGVDTVRVSLLKNIVWVRVNVDGTVDPQAIIQAIADSGDYTATVSTGG